MEVAEASRCDNNKRVEEARRARVEWLEKLRRECGSEEEFETARSQPTWTEIDSTPCSPSCAPDGPSTADLERVRHENRLHFQHLLDTQSPYPPEDFRDSDIQALRNNRSPDLPPPSFSNSSRLFFVDCEDRLEVGEKIGGGGQAEVHPAIYDGKVLDSYVLKVFRENYYLADLQRLWMRNIAETSVAWRILGLNSCCIANYGTILQDGRFAFILRLYSSDLRKFIDSGILKDKTYQRPLFPLSTNWLLMYSIASGMKALHWVGIIHRDLKAENCLIMKNLKDPWQIEDCQVADFDSLEGVIGTRFWRAPEVLIALKNKRRGLPLDS